MNYPILKKKDLFREREDFYISKSTSVPEFVGRMHTHDFLELTYVTSGECEHVENNNSFHFKKGALYVLDYGVPHANIKSEHGTEPFVAYDFAFTPEFLDATLIGSTKLTSLRNSYLFRALFVNHDEDATYLHLTDNAFHEFEHLLKLMLTEYTECKQGYAELLRVYLAELLIKVFRHTLDETKRPPKQNCIEQSIRYVDMHYADKISFDDVAQRSFYSKAYFGQLFKLATDMSFTDYLQKVRIDRACELLKATDQTITTVAENTGFHDMKFFYAVFRKLIGMTPKEYRETALDAPRIMESDPNTPSHGE